MGRSRLFRAAASWALLPALGMVGVLVPARSVRAAISAADGRVEASVQQTNATTGTLIDQAFEETPGTTNILPAQVRAALDVVDADAVRGGLVATATVNPPAETASVEQTKDFSLEAAGLSLPADRSFSCVARSIENRQVVFGEEELALNRGTRVLVRSSLVISAGVFLITLPGSAGNVEGTVSFTVRQSDRLGSHGLLDGSVRVFFDASGQLQIENSGDASLVVAVPFDFSGRSSSVEQAQMVLLPFLSIPYEYEATVGESFTLTAEVEAAASSPSGAQGASAFLGQTPSAFLGMVMEQLAVDLGSSVGGATGSAAVQRAAGLVNGQMEITPLASGRCGDFGLESLLGGLLMGAALVGRRLT